MKLSPRLYMAKLYVQLIFWVLATIVLLLFCGFMIQHLIDLVSPYF